MSPESWRTPLRFPQRRDQTCTSCRSICRLRPHEGFPCRRRPSRLDAWPRILWCWTSVRCPSWGRSRPRRPRRAACFVCAIAILDMLAAKPAAPMTSTRLEMGIRLLLRFRCVDSPLQHWMCERSLGGARLIASRPGLVARVTGRRFFYLLQDSTEVVGLGSLQRRIRCV